jgi:hypothetical protein
MTAVNVDADPVRQFGAGLPNWLRGRVHRTQAIAGYITAAVAGGWTIPQLLAEATRDIPPGHPNPGRIVTHRLAEAAHAAPPQAIPGIARYTQPKPWCGRCSDPQTRWIETIDGKLRRCPDCWTPPRTDT